MASGHGANIGLGSGLGGAPAINNATRFDVWPPCGHRQRLVKGGTICSPPADDAIGTWTASGGGTGRAGRWSQAVVADHAPLRGLLVGSFNPALHPRQALLHRTSPTLCCATTGRTTCWASSSSKCCTTLHSAGDRGLRVKASQVFDKRPRHSDSLHRREEGGVGHRVKRLRDIEEHQRDRFQLLA